MTRKVVISVFKVDFYYTVQIFTDLLIWNNNWFVTNKRK